MSWRIRILISFPGDNDPDLSLPHHSALELSLYCPLKELGFDEAQFSSVQSLSRVRLCDPMDCSTPGLPVHHQLPEFTQTHVH